VSARSRRQIGLCPDCGADVQITDLDDEIEEVVCPDCDWWSVCGRGRTTYPDGGPDWEMPQGHGQPARPPIPPRVVVLPAIAFVGAVFGAVLGALTSPATAILLVATVIAVAVGSIALAREVRR
jgi:hypothetical protein